MGTVLKDMRRRYKALCIRFGQGAGRWKRSIRLRRDRLETSNHGPFVAGFKAAEKFLLPNDFTHCRRIDGFIGGLCQLSGISICSFYLNVSEYAI